MISVSSRIFRTSQARCLFDQGQFDPTLDHAAEGIFPGERFDADQQCKYYALRKIHFHTITYV